jgi:hypothetical protein
MNNQIVFAILWIFSTLFFCNCEFYTICRTYEQDIQNKILAVENGWDRPVFVFRNDPRDIPQSQNENMMQLVVKLNSEDPQIKSMTEPLYMTFYSFPGYKIIVPGNKCEITFEKNPYDWQEEFFIQWDNKYSKINTNKHFIIRVHNAAGTFDKYQLITLERNLIDPETQLHKCHDFESSLSPVDTRVDYDVEGSLTVQSSIMFSKILQSSRDRYLTFSFRTLDLKFNYETVDINVIKNQNYEILGFPDKGPSCFSTASTPENGFSDWQKIVLKWNDFTSPIETTIDIEIKYGTKSFRRLNFQSTRVSFPVRRKLLEEVTLVTLE